MSHYNYYRRTSIDKFNNRPPFDIKKMDDATSTENKEQSTSFCNNCEKIYMNTAAKSYINVAKYLEQFGDKYQMSVNNKNKNVIPKVIQSFQNVDPKKMPKGKTSKKKSDSLETLYRSSGQTFGKILPDHKLMKDLLKNFDDENAMEKSYQQIDIIPSKDVDANLSRSVIDKLTIRVNKGTSTTGLQWPVAQNQMENCRINSKCHVKHNNFGKLKSKIPQRKEFCMNNFCKFINHQPRCNIDGKKSSDSSDLEYFPTKELPFKKPDLASKIPFPSKLPNNFDKLTNDKEFPIYKYNANQDNLKKENTYILPPDNRRNSVGKMKHKKEKSFVQLQVEKFNKRNSNRNIHYRGFPSSNNLKATNFQDKKKTMNKHYISLMNSVKDSLPRMEGHSASDSESHEWSDNHAKTDHQVQFPKETRNAMEHLMKNFKRVPLREYVKEMVIHPAIPINYHAEYKECNTTYSGVSQKKSSTSPCSRKNLCQRSCHDGACTRPETISSSRYANTKNRLRIKRKGS